MHIQLAGTDGQKYDQCEQVFINFTNKYRSTKPSQSMGKWYFEVTHITGKPSFYAGFRHSSGAGVYYYKTKIEKYLIFNSKTVKTKLESHSKLNWTQVPTVIGIGIDLDQNRILFRNDFQIISYEYDVNPNTNNYWDFYLAEGVNNETDTNHDYVKVNFGAYKFKYTVPSGYIPWNSPYRSCLSFHQKTFFSKFIIFITLFCFSS